MPPGDTGFALKGAGPEAPGAGMGVAPSDAGAGLAKGEADDTPPTEGAGDVLVAEGDVGANGGGGVPGAAPGTGEGTGRDGEAVAFP